MSIVRVFAGAAVAELLVGEDHLLAVAVVAVADLLEGDLDVLLRAEPVDLDRRVVLRVELAEVDVGVDDAAVERDRDVDEPEAERAGPQRPGHQAAAFVRLPFARRLRLPPPFMLASSVATRSSAGSGSSIRGTSIFLPAALRSMTFSTARR